MPLDRFGTMPEGRADGEGFRPGHQELIADAVGQASSLVDEAKFDEAEPVIRFLITAYERLTGSMSLEVAVTCEQLAGVLVARDDLGEAASLYERALRIRRELFEESHPSIARTLHDLAVLREALGAPEEARLLWAEARSILENNTG